MGRAPGGGGPGKDTLGGPPCGLAAPEGGGKYDVDIGNGRAMWAGPHSDTMDDQSRARATSTGDGQHTHKGTIQSAGLMIHEEEEEQDAKRKQCREHWISESANIRVMGLGSICDVFPRRDQTRAVEKSGN